MLFRSPAKKDTTITERNFRSVIRHLPKIGLDLALGGGEIFTIKDTLYSYLEYIGFENQKRKKKNQGSIKIEVQTNGFWGTSNARASNTLNELSKLGVTSIDIAAKDKYHFEQGLKKENLQRIVDIGEEYTDIKPIETRGTQKRCYVVPLGRAAKNGFRAREMKIPKGWIYCKNALNDYKLTIRQNGSVHPCCFDIFQLPGNVIQEPLVDIVKKARKQTKFRLLNGKGPKPIIIQEGYDRRKINELIKKRSWCGMCFYTYLKDQ